MQISLERIPPAYQVLADGLSNPLVNLFGLFQRYRILRLDRESHFPLLAGLAQFTLVGQIGRSFAVRRDQRFNSRLPWHVMRRLSLTLGGTRNFCLPRTDTRS